MVHHDATPDIAMHKGQSLVDRSMRGHSERHSQDGSDKLKPGYHFAMQHANSDLPIPAVPEAECPKPPQPGVGVWEYAFFTFHNEIELTNDQNSKRSAYSCACGLQYFVLVEAYHMHISRPRGTCLRVHAISNLPSSDLKYNTPA